MLFNSKRNFKDHMMHALVGFFVGAAVMSLLSSKSAGVSETEANEQKRFDGADDRPPSLPSPSCPPSQSKTVQTTMMTSPMFNTDDELFLGPETGDLPPARRGE